MSEGRVVITSEASLNPEEVAHRGFSSSFRGFDPNEVRAYLRKVAEELRVLRERERSMRQSLDEARHAAAHPPPPDESMLMSFLGEEAGRVLQTAKEAGADIRTKAEEKAGRLLRETEEKAARILREAEERAALLKRDAETVMAERTDDAEKAAAGIRRAAEAEAASIRAQAQATAAEEIEAAKAHGRELVGEAHALRERVLADLVRRRSMARVQIEQLRAGRERLIEAYRVVRRTLDEATEELSVVETEAKLAADSAARRAAAAPEGSVDDLEADLVTARRAELPLVEPSSTWTPRRSAAEEAASPEAPSPQPAAIASPAVEAPVEPVVRVLQAFDVEAVAAEAAAEVEAESAPVRAAAGVVPGETLDDDGGATAAATSVEDLFARIKADRADAVARARAVLEEAADLVEANLAPGELSKNGSAATTDVDESILQRRDEMLEPLEEQLTRRLKRALQDEQNELLDSIRTSRSPLSELSLEPDAHALRFADVARPVLVQALTQGAGFADPSGGPPDDVDGEAAVVVAALTEELAAPLQKRVDDALHDASNDDDTPRAVDRIGAAYRQWKVEKIGPVARHYVTAAFARGAYLAGAAAGLRWVVDDDGAPCPDCDDNALAGAVPKGEEFPTGQRHPPAHPGCRCVLVPA